MLNLEAPQPLAGPSAPSTLICADNMAVLPELADASLDLIYLDPPFGTGGRRGGAYSDPLADPEQLTQWLRPRLEHCHRALAAHASLFVHLDYRAVHYVKVALDRLFGRARFVNEIIWCYAVGGKSARRFARKHDTILWYARTADYAFFPDRVRVPRRPRSHMRVVRDRNGSAVQEKTDRRTGKVYRYPIEQGKVPEDWWADIETLNRSAAERAGYPTQKPLRLLERIVLACSEPGQQVADFFCGSGTAAVAARAAGRRFLAVDRQPEAIAVARRRLGEGGYRVLDRRSAG